MGLLLSSEDMLAKTGQRWYVSENSKQQSPPLHHASPTRETKVSKPPGYTGEVYYGEGNSDVRSLGLRATRRSVVADSRIAS